MLGTTARREMLAIQMDLDSEIFDSSLGCPLASYQDATLSLVGGESASMLAPHETRLSCPGGVCSSYLRL